MTAHVTAPGAYPRIAADAYHADPPLLTPEPSLSNSLMGKLLRSPRHAWHASPRLNPDFEPTVSEAFDVGNACHAYVTGKGARIVPVDADDWRSKGAREERDAIREAGDVPLLRAQFEAVEAMAEEVRVILNSAGLGEVFADRARNEVPHYAWIDGVLCRAMPDHVGEDGWLYDLKTTTDASADALRRAVEGYGYARQAAHYCDVVEAATGMKPKGMRFVFVEKTPPHEGRVVKLVNDPGAEDDWMGPARDECAAARKLWRACLDADDWPGYPRQVLQLDARPFYARGVEERLALLLKPSKVALRRAAEFQAP